MNLIDDIIDCAVTGNDGRHVEKVFGQVVEEVGEISTAIYRPEKAPEPVFAETCDLIIAATDLAFVEYLKTVGLSVDKFHTLPTRQKHAWVKEFKKELNRVASIKLQKWYRKLNPGRCDE